MKIYLFVFIVFSVLSLSSAQSLPSVLDIEQKFLKSGTNYYILPVLRGRGGGITLAPTIINRTCPLDVVQENSEVKNGLPMTFIPANASSDGIIRESTDLNIQFPGVSVCGQPAVWRLEVMNGQWFFSSRGAVGNPGRSTLFNWFKIEKHSGPRGNGYKLVYCPKVCNTCDPICGDLGVAKGERRSVIISNETLIVMLKRA